ncbi:phosphoenolpyruvate--protein phosphotransferase [Luteithermobacter gelatinilyticus]|uniref:phosphoenolpyruvate--protein phosphotransferase n=1 Tax=Luteithermobacter gelatinilyticus TaxID=2582913 RepID=UPI001106A7F4|nr:phosphoenolpyruvate--protein phosphotransferase [Luteithermobacter gelatinilyticus]
MTPVSSAPRLLLRRLHKIMAGTGSAEDRLNQVVRLIAANMVAEVCSAYFLRGGEILELFATEGLKTSAIHRTRLRVGEGLVGHVASTGTPLSLTDAQNHPKFVYRQETGEEAYHSFLGVPILRAGRVAGVLVIQNRARRQYTEEEVEVLQTVAMVLAELVASGELFDPYEQPEGTLERAATPRFEGVVFSEGLAEGVAVLHEPRVEVIHHISEDPEKEKKRLKKALQDLEQEIDSMMSAEDFRHHGEHREILDVYKLFARDRGWQEKITDAIESGLTAEAAVERVQMENRSRMQQTRDPYLRERLSDLDDLANRLIRHLMGKVGTAAGAALPDNAIVVAQNMGPAELLDYDREKLQAVILQQGSPTAHVAIVARALGIPMVGQVEQAMLHVEEGEQVIVDGVDGVVYFSPQPEILASYQENIRARAELLASYEALRDKPAVTRDGIEIDLFINAGLSVDMDGLERTGALGVGLFRTEFQFMVSATMPKVDIQAEFYRSILESAADKPVVFRTLDIGGDKPVSFLKRDEEANPALGWRAMRISLDRPALLRYQLRALLQATAGKVFYVMFPMIADVSEFQQARAILQRELDWLDKFNKKGPTEIKVGTMLEVPSLLWQLDNLLPLVDFVSVGSNDLMQFFFACDRENPKLADRYDPLSPAALSMLKFIVDKCAEYKVPVTLCGELGGKPLAAMAMLGIGFTRLSIAPASVGPVKMMIRSLDLGQLKSYLDGLLSRPDHSLRGKLIAFARDHGIQI